MPDFRIQVERLTDRRERFTFAVSPGWWRAREPEGQAGECVVEHPLEFALDASRAGDDVLIEGELAGQVGLECSRCAKRYDHALREPYRLVLEPFAAARGDRAALDPEAERGLAENGVCLGEDLEVGLYRGAVVGLDDFFAEVIALALPIQPLCDEDCPGLCPHCGRARGGADGDCACEDERIESPFAVLAQLKDKARD